MKLYLLFFCTSATCYHAKNREVLVSGTWAIGYEQIRLVIVR